MIIYIKPIIKKDMKGELHTDNWSSIVEEIAIGQNKNTYLIECQLKSNKSDNLVKEVLDSLDLSNLIPLSMISYLYSNGYYRLDSGRGFDVIFTLDNSLYTKERLYDTNLERYPTKWFESDSVIPHFLMTKYINDKDKEKDEDDMAIEKISLKSYTINEGAHRLTYSLEGEDVVYKIAKSRMDVLHNKYEYKIYFRYPLLRPFLAKNYTFQYDYCMIIQEKLTPISEWLTYKSKEETVQIFNQIYDLESLCSHYGIKDAKLWNMGVDKNGIVKLFDYGEFYD